MRVEVIHEPEEAFRFLANKNRCDYIYQFYNLAANNWKQTICYGLYSGTELCQIAMISMGYGIPVLLAANFEDSKRNIELVGKLRDFLPKSFYTHMDIETLHSVFEKEKLTEYHEYLNMGYDIQRETVMPPVQVDRLGIEELNKIERLISESYPDAWLDEELIKLGRNFGVYSGERLVSFAGIHAYSEKYQVSAVAHVTTHPEFRRQGLGEAAVAALINDLKKDIKYIGLNVKVDNQAAINCYKKLGFQELSRFAACQIDL